MFIYTFSLTKQPKKKDNLKDKVSLTRYISIPWSDFELFVKDHDNSMQMADTWLFS